MPAEKQSVVRLTSSWVKRTTLYIIAASQLSSLKTIAEDELQCRVASSGKHFGESS